MTPRNRPSYVARPQLIVAGAVAGLTAALITLSTAPVRAQNVDLSNIDNGTGGFVINGQAAGEYSGECVASAGDVNGDGLADLIVGAILSDPAAGTNAGRSYVVFGKADGADVELLAVDSGTGGFVINGQASYDNSGISVSGAGDVNGDGLADVIVGAFLSDPAAGSSAGRSYVVFGKTSGAGVDLSAIANGVGGFVINGQAIGDQSGRSVSSAGDVNGDGLADVIVGASFSDPAAGSNAGRSYVVFGKTAGGEVDLSAIDDGVGGFVINGQGGSDYSGSSVASAGDVNGDGLADVIVGAIASDPAAGPNAGRSYVVFGKASGADVELSAVDAGSGGFVINGQAAGDSSGRSVSSAGDVNGDGLADLIVGAQASDPLAGASAGRSYVVFGKSGGAGIDLTTIDNGVGGFVINGQAANDQSGRWVSSAGDVNGDGLADVIVGAPFSDPATGSNAGRSYVVLGKTGTAGVDLSAIDAGVGGFTINGQTAEDKSGFSVSSAGDVNGDGLADLVVGTSGSDSPAGIGAGRSYVVWSNTSSVGGAYRGFVRSGDADRQGIGVHRFGDDLTAFPDSRLWVDFDGGSGPGLAGSSRVTATLTRNNLGLQGINPSKSANVQWELQAQRTGWTTCRVTVRYTDAEITGLDEANLVLHTARFDTGPFNPVANQSHDLARNELTGDVTIIAPFAYLAIVGDSTPPVATISRLLPATTADQVPTWSLSFNEPLAGTIDSGDIIPTGSLAGSVVGSLIQNPTPPFTVRLVTAGETLNGTLGFDLAAGAVTDTSANPVALTAAPAYTINEVGAGAIAGDVDKDGFVTVADVTTLANFIVNGAPPLP